MAQGVRITKNNSKAVKAEAARPFLRPAVYRSIEKIKQLFRRK